jgi:uncharacterized protein YggU (UPF0235/DUF167 family)
MLHPVANLRVRVVPRSGRTAVERGPGSEVVVRVRAAPQAGRATAEAAGALAAATGLPKSAVSLRTGARSRTKVFTLEGLSDDDLAAFREGL